MSKYVVAVPTDPRRRKYEYLSEGAGPFSFTDCVFDAVWYDDKMHAELVRSNLMDKRNRYAFVLPVADVIYQLDMENGYEPFYIIRDQSDNRIVREVRALFNITLFTYDLKDAMKYRSAANAIDAINDVNRGTLKPYDLVVEMHHFDEFYKDQSDAPWMYIYGGRGGGKTHARVRLDEKAWLSENPNIPEMVRNQARNLEHNYIMSAKEMYATMFGIQYHIPEIKKVIFSNSVTIVLWKDGTKTIVRCQDGEHFDPEKGLAMAFMKKAFGNKGNYFDKVRNLLNNATYQCDDPADHKDSKDRKGSKGQKGCKDDAPLAKKTKHGTYKCPHCSRFVPSKCIEGKKGPFTCDKCGKKFNINWEGELDYEY